LRSNLPPEILALEPARLELLLAQARNIVQNRVSGAADPAILAALESYDGAHRIGVWAGIGVALAVALGGLAIGQRHIGPSLRARDAVERVVKAVMILASTIAVLTTVGIVLSLVFEAARFFAAVPIGEFLFGLHWSPQI